MNLKDRDCSDASQGGEAVQALVLDDCVEMHSREYGGGYFGTDVVTLYTPPADPDAVAVRRELLEMEWLEGWLRFAAEPIGQECCGRAGQECCGCPEPVYPDIQHIGQAMDSRWKELRALLADEEGVK